MSSELIPHEKLGHIYNFFAIALSFVFARTGIRLRYQKRLFIDDIFLYFGVICLCAALGLYLEFSKDMFLNEALMTKPLQTKLPSDYLSIWIRFHKMSASYLALTYTTIFSVKFSFLFFFRTLTQRARQMVIYWWMVLFILVVTWIITVVAVDFVCLDFGIGSCTIGLIPFLLNVER